MKSDFKKDKQNLLFISKDNITTTPRIKKEILAAKKQNFNIIFLGFDIKNWSDQIEKKFHKENPEIKFIYLPASYKSKSLLWLLSVIIEKLARALWPVFKQSIVLSAFAHSRRSFALWWYLLFHKQDFDFISAHTLPTIFPAYHFARKQNIPWSFDIEDYHPGEKIAKDTENETKRRELLLRKLIPQTTFFTYASPLFLEQIKNLTAKENLPQNIFIANSFAQDYFSLKINTSNKISFVWFSQNIAQSRGLELLLPALWEHKDKVKITLIGNLYQEFYDNFLAQYQEFLTIKPPMNETKLYAEICRHDIGCAIELDSADFNRKIALTNKIYAYAQAGLFILATDTKAQKWFIEKYPYFGILSGQTINDLTNKVQFIIKKNGLIRSTKNLRFAKAKELSWDNEQNKLIQLWRKSF